MYVNVINWYFLNTEYYTQEGDTGNEDDTSFAGFQTW